MATAATICERGFDPDFWVYHREERVETNVDLFVSHKELTTWDEWIAAFPSVGHLSWFLFGNDDAKRGWCYSELADLLVHRDFIRPGEPLIENEARLTNAILGCRALGQIDGPGVVFCNPGPKATMPRHSTLHVFTVVPTAMADATAEVTERMAQAGYISLPRSTLFAIPTTVSFKRQSITPDLRADVWDKSRGICWYCGVDLHPFRNYHVDHFIPVVDGGSNEIANLVPCCQPCNTRKQARPAEYLRRFIGSGVFWFEKEGKS